MWHEIFLTFDRYSNVKRSLHSNGCRLSATGKDRQISARVPFFEGLELIQITIIFAILEEY
ncbi:hypothetical protein CKA32_000839 [Geitlerinema sp. FC II]|nr:hypothetical protein CKA32_000839 [Geitlerinema sp. FC II]